MIENSSKYYVFLMTRSLDEGIFSDILKLANGIPKFEKEINLNHLELQTSCTIELYWKTLRKDCS